MSRPQRLKRGRTAPCPCPVCGAVRPSDHPARLCLQCAGAARAVRREAAEAAAALAEPAPARYAPGTPEAVALLAARHARGERLWAAGDEPTCEGLAGPHPGIAPGQKGPHCGDAPGPWRAEREPHAYPSHPRGRR